MALKRMSSHKRDDFAYESPDGEKYDITIVQTPERKYVEIKQNIEGEMNQVNWDVEMLLDIADAVRGVVQKPNLNFPPGVRGIPKPNIVDNRSSSEIIQASVDASMENPISITPVQSLEAEIEQRMTRGVPAASVEAKIKRTSYGV